MKLVELPSTPLICKNLVKGTWHLPSVQSGAKVISPYTGACIGEVQFSNKQDVDQAVAAAKEAFPKWRATPIKERCALLFKFRELALTRLDKLSNLAAAEAGKTVEEARAGILKGLEVAEYALSLQNMNSGGIMEVSRGVTCEYRREPLGVVVGISPFNFPAMVPLWMYPIALALGNCFILKPSEKVPLTSQLIGEIIVEAGFPAGVFSIVNGGRETVEMLIDHVDVKAVGFVGSTPAAKAVYTRATTQGKRALCLGGAKNSLIVVPDADPKVTVPGVIASFTGCAGQRCMAASLMIAVGNSDSLINQIKEKAATMTIGCGMGAIISKEAKERIITAINNAEANGAKIILDGRNITPPSGHEGGFWLGPTIIDNAKPEMECAKTEIFGPVLTIVRAKDLSEALAIDAQSSYGNATSVFTTTGSVARRVAEASSSGMVGINIGVPVPREPFSFGGTKDSKFGHGDMTGESSLDFWTDRKKITTKWDVQTDTTWMG
jgi:malonate-semialdehyde dehydrogenase (acetylating)/methylmalonate-semialdehyde dehydrogenase